ncbi:unnamed protein product [Mucor circinelloides]
MAHVAAEDYWRVYVPVVPVQAVAECRLLRNFTKRASGFKWHLKSERFHVNEFSTACALRLHTVRSVDSIVAIGSLLLDWKVLDQENKQQLRSMLSNVEVLRGMAVDATSKSVATVRELQLSRGKKLALEIAFLVLGDEQVENSLYVEMFKALMSPRLKTLNNQAIRQKKYLLV